MSSNHTKVKTSEWEAMNREVSRTDAYLIQSGKELEEIEAQILQREEELREAQAAGDASVCEAMEAFAESFREIGAQILDSADREVRSLEQEFQSIRSTLAAAGAETAELNRRTEQLARRYADAFDRLLEQTANRSERAVAALRQLDALIDQIRGQKPEILLPAKYQEILSLRNALAEDIRCGDFQAALAAAGNGIVNAGALLSRLILMNDAYNSALTDVRGYADRIRAGADRLNAASGSLTCTIHGQPTSFDYNLSRWSGGKYEELRADFEAVCRRLDQGDLTLEQLTQIRSALAQYEAAFEHCDREARTRRACAIAAEDLSLTLYDALTEDPAWAVTQSGYVDGDDRNPYTFAIEDDCGNQIAFVVNPDSPETPTFLMEAFSEDEFLPARIKDNVRSLLASHGVTVEGYEERDDCSLHADAAAFLQNAGEEAVRYHRY